MPEKTITILSGAEAADRIRGQKEILRQLITELPSTKAAIQHLLEDCPDDAEAITRFVDGKAGAKLRKFEEGKASIATVGGEIAGMAHYEEVGEWNGRKVFEICANVVLPSFREKGLSSRIALDCIRQVHALEPDALCLGQSGNPRILSRYHRWMEAGIARSIPADEYVDMARAFENKPTLSLKERNQVIDWYADCEVVLIDPRKLFASGDLI